MPISLTDEEARAVKALLDKYMPELDYELARIKLERDRDSLVEFERVLANLRKKL